VTWRDAQRMLPAEAVHGRADFAETGRGVESLGAALLAVTDAGQIRDQWREDGDQQKKENDGRGYDRDLVATDPLERYPCRRASLDLLIRLVRCRVGHLGSECHANRPSAPMSHRCSDSRHSLDQWARPRGPQRDNGLGTLSAHPRDHACSYVRDARITDESSH